MKLLPGDAPLARRLAVAVAALAPLVIWWLRRDPTAPTDLATPCLLRAVTGVPCPTCGGTRAAIALAQGRPLAALADNPLVTVVVAATVVWAVCGIVATLVPRWRRRIERSPGDGRRLVLLALGLVAANWVWLIATG